MRKYIFLFLLIGSLFGQAKQKDWSDKTINYPAAKDDSSSLMYADPGEKITSDQYNKLLRAIRIIQDKLGIGSSSPGTPGQILKVQGDGFSTLWDFNATDADSLVWRTEAKDTNDILRAAISNISQDSIYDNLIINKQQRIRENVNIKGNISISPNHPYPKSTTKGYWSFIIDGAFMETDTNCWQKVFEPRNIPFNIMCSVNAQVEGSAYMGYARLKELQDAGCEIGVHSWTVTYDYLIYDTYGPDSLYNWLKGAIDSLEYHGLIVNNRVYGMGSSYTRTRYINQLLFRSAFGVSGTDHEWDATLTGYNKIPIHQYNLNRLSLDPPSADWSTARRSIDSVAVWGGWAVCYAHAYQAEWTDALWDSLGSLVDYAISKLDTNHVLTINDVIDSIGNVLQVGDYSQTSNDDIEQDFFVIDPNGKPKTYGNPTHQYHYKSGYDGTSEVSTWVDHSLSWRTISSPTGMMNQTGTVITLNPDSARPAYAFQMFKAYDSNYLAVRGAETDGSWQPWYQVPYLIAQGTVAWNRGSITANTTVDTAFNVSTSIIYGVTLGAYDLVMLDPQGGAFETGILWDAFIKDADEIYIRLANITTGAIDPANHNWRYIIFRYTW